MKLRSSAAAGLLAALLPLAAGAASLENELGRNETRIYSEPFAIEAGAVARDLALVERLERLGYRRVHERPDQAGEFFYGNEVIWIYRRATHARGEDRARRAVRPRSRRQHRQGSRPA